MEWNKAGRPHKVCDGTVKDERSGTANGNDGPWKSRELVLHKHAMRALAASVLRQWADDGKPSSDEEGVKVWLSLISMERRNDDRKAELPKLGDLTLV